MEIIKQCKKIEAKTGEKTFKCSCCNCEWTAKPNEYVTIHTPMKPNTYCYCPNCNNQTWEQES